MPTLLLTDIGHLHGPMRSQFAEQLRQLSSNCQMIATIEKGPEPVCQLDDELSSLLGTITIDLLPLAKRREDIPLLTQFFLEEANVDTSRQVGSASPEVLEWLALYAWPGETAEFREVVRAAHASCSGHEIQVSDLPAVIHHAAQAAQFSELPAETIALDEFMLGIERELVQRAMEQSKGNKAHAARLLGMTRPRLYRRLVQLGLIDSGEKPKAQTREELADGIS